MREWIAKNILGLTKAPEARIIDVKAELSEGKSILLDTSDRMPMREWFTPITNWPEYINQPTVEIRTFTNPWPHYKNHDTSKFLETGLWAIEGEDFMLLSDTRNGMGEDDNSSIDLISELARHAVMTHKKLAVFIDHSKFTLNQMNLYLGQVIKAVTDAAEHNALKGDRKAPLFVLDLMENHETFGFGLCATRLMDIGPTVITRLMTGSPKQGLTAETHIVEHIRFRKHLRSEAEVILIDNNRGMIKDHPRNNFKFRKWDYRGYNFEATPRVGTLGYYSDRLNPPQ